MNERVCPKCGGRRFFAHQVQRHDVIVDGDNNWIEQPPESSYDSESPYGPYVCEKCGAEYDSLDALAEEPFYQTLLFSNVSEDHSLEFEERVFRSNLQQKLSEAVERYAMDEDCHGYYCFKAYCGLVEDSNTVKGCLYVKKTGSKVEVKVLEDPDENKGKEVLISMKVLAKFKDLNIRKLEDDQELYIFETHYPYLFRETVKAEVLADHGKWIKLAVIDLTPMVTTMTITKNQYTQALIQAGE